jgi:ribosomal-protein-alanine N-acetyltransferase
MAAETKREQAAATIRVFLPADAAAVTEILKGSPEASQWTEWGFRELLGWRGVLALVREDDRKVIGFIIGRQVGGEAEILNAAVIVARRRKGEGGALLKAVMDEFRARRVSRVFLEVRESNAGAIAFYHELGFQAIGVRKGYYRGPSESATVMELWLGKSTV